MPSDVTTETTATPGWVRRLWGYMMRHRRDVTLAVSAALLGSVCQTTIPLIERQIVDGVVVAHTSSLWPWLVLLVALALASFGFLYVRRYRGGRVALSVQYDLRNAMHAHLQAMDFDNLDRMPTGQVVARANSDSALVQGLLSFFPIMSGNILLMLFSLGVMFYLSPLLVGRQRDHRADVAHRFLPDAAAGLSRHMGRATARRRCHPNSGRRRQRCAGRQGIRPGAA